MPFEKMKEIPFHDGEKKIEILEKSSIEKREGWPDESGEINHKGKLPDEGTLTKKIVDNEYEVDKSEVNEKEHILTSEDRIKIKEVTGWSSEIVNSIKTKEEYEIYRKAGLREEIINGKPCLVRSDINWDQKDVMGRTNKERAEQGLPPLDKNGKAIELHHIGQKNDSPLAELTQEEHRGKGNDVILHQKNKESEIDRGAFARERSEHWTARV